MASAAAHLDSEGHHNQIYIYFGALTLLVALASPTGYLFDIPMSYVLKNQLHGSATQVSAFRLVTAVPVYLAFVFGLICDRRNPFGMRDRGYFVLFVPLTTAAFFWMASARLTYAGLLAGTLLVMLSFRFVMAAYHALIAQEKVMSGRLAAVWQTVSIAMTALGAVASGYVTENFSAAGIFFLMVVLVLLIAGIGLLKPRSIFSHAYDQEQAKGSNFFGDVRRLVKTPCSLTTQQSSARPLFRRSYSTAICARRCVYGNCSGWVRSQASRA